jgi:hypothetical protein
MLSMWDVGALETPTSTYNHCPSVPAQLRFGGPEKGRPNAG